jgi:hypothetical protein
MASESQTESHEDGLGRKDPLKHGHYRYAATCALGYSVLPKVFSIALDAAR